MVSAVIITSIFGIERYKLIHSLFTKTLKYNEGWNIGWAAFLRAKTYFFVREHHLKFWIIIKDNQSANFVLNKGLKF